MTTPFQSVERGIIFLMAEWSGGAQWAYRQLVAFLDQHGIPAQRLIVLNVDHHPELYDLPEFSGKIHGWGEVSLVRDGKVVFFTVLGKDQPKIQERCEELLRAYNAEPGPSSAF